LQPTFTIAYNFSNPMYIPYYIRNVSDAQASP
jgi:hypothetical protein